MSSARLCGAFSGTPDAPVWHCVQATANSTCGPRQAASPSKSPLKVKCSEISSSGSHSSIAVFSDVEEGQCSDSLSFVRELLHAGSKRSLFQF